VADGQVLIDTKIDTDGIELGVGEIKKAFSRMASEAAKLQSSGRKACEAQMQALAQASDAGAAVMEKEARKYTELIQEHEAEMNQLSALKEQFLSVGGDENSQYFQELQERSAQTAEALQFCRDKLSSIQEAGAAAASGLEQAGASAEQAAAETMAVIGPIQSMALQLSKALNYIADSAAKLPGMAKNAIVGFVSSAVEQLKKLASAARKAALALAQLVGRGLIGGLKKISSGIFGLSKNTQQSGKSFGASLKTILKYSLGIRSLYMLVNKLRSALVEGFKNLAQYSSGTNQALSGLMSSLTQCKNALATAFDPILQAAAPALNYLINLVTQAATAVAQLMSVLTGKGTYTKAVKVQQDYAKSLKGTGSAAKEAGEDAEGALAPFDKLNVMADQATSTSGGGGGADTSAADMFETVPIESSFQSMADTLKSFIQSQDWSGLGAYIANGLNIGLQKIYDAINWDNVGPRITYFVNAFTETFNSLVDNLNWDLLGRTIGAGINTIVNTLNLLIEGIDWVNLGKKLGEGANGLVDEIDWTAIGHLIGNKLMLLPQIVLGFAKEFDWSALGIGIGDLINGAIEKIDPGVLAESLSVLAKGILDGISAALKETDWQEIGNKVAEFLEQIDWSGISQSLFYAIGAALASLAEFIWGLIEDAWKSVVKWWQDVAYEDGQFTIEGLLNGISDALKNIGSWIKTNVWEPMKKGFQDAFGIHSPSTKMKELGGYLMEGLQNGISEFIPNLIEKFTEIKDRISEKWDEIKASSAEKWDGIKSTLSEKWDALKEHAGTKFGDMKDTISDLWSKIKENASELWGENGISGIVKGCINGIITMAENMANSVIRVINGLIGGINTLGINIPATPFSDAVSLKLNVPEISEVHLPRLASGTVVPPRAGEFAAILGDNNRETEVVSPLSTIEQALENVMSRMQTGTQEINLSVNLDGRQIYKTVVNLNRESKKATGRNLLLV
jgi:hypothetical protein